METVALIACVMLALLFWAPTLCFLCAKLGRYGYLCANRQFHDNTTQPVSRKECSHGRP